MVFWAVSVVIIVVPYTPKAENVFKSACMPAPADESLPAIVITFFNLLIPSYWVGVRSKLMSLVTPDVNSYIYKKL